MAIYNLDDDSGFDTITLAWATYVLPSDLSKHQGVIDQIKAIDTTKSKDYLNYTRSHICIDLISKYNDTVPKVVQPIDLAKFITYITKYL